MKYAFLLITFWTTLLTAELQQIVDVNEMVQREAVAAGCASYWPQYVKRELQLKAGRAQNRTYPDILHRGIDPPVLDFLAAEYFDKEPLAFLVVIWPKFDYLNQQIKQELQNFASIVYHKSFPLRGEGPAYLIEKIKGASELKNHVKFFPTSGRKSEMLVMLLKADRHDDLKSVLEHITRNPLFTRHYIDVITDRTRGSLLSSVFFNENSIDFINTFRRKVATRFERDFLQFAKQLRTEHPAAAKKVCIDGDAMLGLFGRGRDPIKISLFGELSELAPLVERYGLIDHTDFWTELGIHRDHFVADPRNYLTYEGVKVIAPKALKTLVERNPIHYSVSDEDLAIFRKQIQKINGL